MLPTGYLSISDHSKQVTAIYYIILILDMRNMGNQYMRLVKLRESLASRYFKTLRVKLRYTLHE